MRYLGTIAHQPKDLLDLSMNPSALRGDAQRVRWWRRVWRRVRRMVRW